MSEQQAEQRLQQKLLFHHDGRFRMEGLACRYATLRTQKDRSDGRCSPAELPSTISFALQQNDEEQSMHWRHHAAGRRDTNLVKERKRCH